MHEDERRNEQSNQISMHIDFCSLAWNSAQSIFTIYSMNINIFSFHSKLCFDNPYRELARASESDIARKKICEPVAFVNEAHGNF